MNSDLVARDTQRKAAECRHPLRSSSTLVAAGWFVVGVLALGVVGARAELVYFRGGGEAQVAASWDGPALRVVIPGRTFRFRNSDLRRVVPGFWPEQEWPQREAKGLAGGADARFAAAWWALENGLIPQAESMLRQAHQSDPKHQPTLRMVRMLDRLARAGADPDVTPIELALGGHTSIARGPHVLLVHQHPESEATERLDLLERVVAAYYLLFASQGIELPVPERRMVSCWFARHDDYLAYLNRANLNVFRSTRGYYHPTLNAVLAYDGRSSGTQKQTRDALASRADELQKMADLIDRLPARARLGFEVRGEPKVLLTRAAAQTRLETLRADVERRELLVELDWRSVDLGTAAHEMVHQLVATSGLASRHDDFPIWLHEGFAAQFEVIRGGRWSGIGRAHDIRLADWRALPTFPPLMPLVRDTGFGRGYQRGLYAQAWGLVYFLRKEHPEQFLTFLDMLRSPDVDSDRGKAHVVDAFHAAFGEDVEELEAAWHRYLSTAKTPLDENRRDETRESRRRTGSQPLRD